MKRDRIRLIIADDQILFAESLRYVLSNISDRFDILGVFSDGEKALEFIERDQPDLVLMDIRMPVMDGVEATRLIHQRFPAVRIVMLTTFDDDEYILHAVKHGAAGYLLKSIRPDDLASSIEAVMGGATLFSKKISEKLKLAEQAAESEMDLVFRYLTKREKDVLNRVMDLMNNRQVADSLGLSEQRVRNYVHSLYEAFGVHDRMELVKKLKGAWPMDRR